MDADPIRFDEYLQDVTIFHVPITQRPFGWGKEEVNDYVYDLILAGRKKEWKKYMFGTMIIQKEDGIGLNGISHTRIVEGQQRTITNSLGYFAVYLFLRDNPELCVGDLKNPDIFLNFIYNNQDKNSIKLDLQPEDMNDYIDILHENFENNSSHMYQMFKLIQNRINKSNYIHFIMGLKKLEAVIVKLGPDDDADLIFDTINSRGKPLTFIDKLKNVCLLNLETKLQEKTYYQKWMPFYNKFLEYHFDTIETDWVKGFNTLHHLIRPEKATKNYLIKHLRAQGSENAMDSIIEYNNTLVHMIEKSEYKNEISQLLLINSISAIVGVYLIDKARKANQLNHKEAHQLVSEIVSYSIRRWIMGEGNKIVQLVWHIAQVVNSNIKGLYGEIHKVCSKYGNHQWEGSPSDEVLMKKIESKEWRKNDNAKRLLVLLETRLNPRCGDLTNMTVEHISPINSRQERLYGSDTNIKLLLGNLTLVSSEDNSRLNNKDFVDKKHMEHGFIESTFKIDEYVKQQETWGKKEIETRTGLLGQCICGLWPEGRVMV